MLAIADAGGLDCRIEVVVPASLGRHDCEMTNDEAWRELAQRLLVNLRNHDTRVQVVLAGIPEEAGGVVPIPSGWHVVGSNLRRIDVGRPVLMLEVIIDADETTPAAALALYASEAAAAGWKTPQDKRRRFGAFLPGDPEELQFQQGGLWLRVSAVQRAGASLDVRVHCTNSHPPRAPGAARGAGDGMAALPSLRVPHGQRLSGSGSSGGVDHFQSDATIDGDTTVPELHAHCAVQLEGAHWQLIDQSGDHRAHWSVWELPDQRWRGLLIVLNPFGTRRASVLLRSEAADKDEEDGASFTVLASRG